MHRFGGAHRLPVWESSGVMTSEVHIIEEWYSRISASSCNWMHVLWEGSHLKYTSPMSLGWSPRVHHLGKEHCFRVEVITLEVHIAGKWSPRMHYCARTENMYVSMLKVRIVSEQWSMKCTLLSKIHHAWQRSRVKCIIFESDNIWSAHCSRVITCEVHINGERSPCEVHLVCEWWQLKCTLFGVILMHTSHAWCSNVRCSHDAPTFGIHMILKRSALTSLQLGPSASVSFFTESTTWCKTNQTIKPDQTRLWPTTQSC